MSSTVHELPLLPNARAVELDGDATEGSRRGQGWLMVLAASALLWTGIIVVVTGIASLIQ